MTKPLGCWCIWCGEYVKQEQMGHHVWRHGWCAKIGTFPPVNCPSPWSKRQGYWSQNPHPPEPISQQLLASQMTSPQGALFPESA